MSKRIFIIHGWDGHPDEQWFPWLKKELEQRGFEVYVPQMPKTEEPGIDTWVPYLKELVGQPDQDAYFVGHSIGSQAVFRYLETLNVKVGGVVSVAGWFTLRPESLENADVARIAKPWQRTPINKEIIKQNAGKIIAIFSDNDKYVGLDNVAIFKNELGAETIVLHNKGHLGAFDNVPIVPEILSAVLKILLKEVEKIA